MKLFLFERINQVSENYHSEGGLVIVAIDRNHAEMLIADDANIQPTESDWGEVVEYTLDRGYTPVFYVFPDAGCC